MPITIVLTAVPAKYVRNNASNEHTLIVKAFGKKYGLALHSVSGMDDIRQAVGHFAQQVHQRFPSYSFAVTVRIRNGDETPRGFQDAVLSGSLGQNRFTRVFEHCTFEEYLADDFIQSAHTGFQT